VLSADSGDIGVVLEPEQIRKLGPSALTLWRWLAAERGYGPRRVDVPRLDQLGALLKLGVRRLKRALSRLRDVGLVDCYYWSKQTGSGRRDWKRRVKVNVWGGEVALRSGPEFWVPTSAGSALSSMSGRGGKRTAKSVRPAAESGGQSVPDPRLNLVQTVPEHDRNNGLARQSVPSSKKHIAVCTSFPLQGKETRQSRRETFLMMNKASGGSNQPASPHTAPGLPIQTAPGLPIQTVDLKTVPRKTTSLPKLTGDPDDPDERIRRRLTHEWLKLLVDAYSAAYRARGVTTWLTLPGARRQDVAFCTVLADGTVKPAVQTGPPLEKWKHYAKLMECARALQDHNIPPHAWAAWAVGRGTHGRTLPATSVFVAAHVNSRAHRGIFRKESGYGHGDGSLALTPTPNHFEQLYRAQEARRLRDGRGDPTTGCLWGFPPWYFELRREEIRQGVEDPMERYPQIKPLAVQP